MSSHSPVAQAAIAAATGSSIAARSGAAAWVQRRRGTHNGHSNDLSVGAAWLNDVLERPLALEASWLRRGHTLPAGLSLLAVLSKPGTGS